MRCLLEVGECVRGIVTSTANAATDQTEPEVEICMADITFVYRGRERQITVFICPCDTTTNVVVPISILCESTHWTPTPFPFLETGAVKHVLTDNGK